MTGVSKRPIVSKDTQPFSDKENMRGQHTFGDHALQVNDVWMVELAHDAGLGQEIPPLFVGVASLEGLDGHADLSLARHLQAPAAHLAELACQNSLKTPSRVGQTARAPLHAREVEGVDFKHRSGSLIPPTTPLPAGTRAELMGKWTY